LKRVFLAFLSISFLYANSISWRGDYNKALQEAQKNHKVLMVLLIKSDCQKCKEVIRDIFTNKSYINRLKKEVVAVIVNIDNKKSYPIELYWSNIYPTLFFVDSSKEIFLTQPIYNITPHKIETLF
jgi:thioredoxin-related protein